MSNTIYISALALAASIVCGACCAFVGPCTNYDGAPEVSWVDSRGRVIPLDSTGIEVLYVTNLADGNRTFEGLWQVSDNPNGAGSVGPPVLSLIDVGSHASKEEGSFRANRVIVEYRYRGQVLVDTIAYDGVVVEDGCCTDGRIEPVKNVSGPLVVGFRNRTDFPAVDIVLRDTI